MFFITLKFILEHKYIFLFFDGTLPLKYVFPYVTGSEKTRHIGQSMKF